MKINQTVTKLILLSLLTFSFIFTFFSGYFIKTAITPVAIPTPTVINPVPSPILNYTPGKHFFEDGFYLQTVAEPKIALIASVSRKEGTTGFTQNTRVTILQPGFQKRYTQISNILDSKATSDLYVKNWQTTIDPSRVLKESSQFNFQLENQSINVKTSTLENEMTTRSLPAYTKIFSNGTAVITINNRSYQANLLYYRLYSNNQNDLYFYTNSLGITTDIAALWDPQGNVVFIDRTEVTNPVEKYQSHSLAIQSLITKQVLRTFDLTIDRSATLPPNKYKISLAAPINSLINLSTFQSLDKSSGNENWFLSQATGSSSQNNITTPLSGLIEYFKD